MLLTAAEKTDGVKTEPAPSVLQTALSDFYIHYSLRVQTDDLNGAPGILSRLHQNIQDVFAENGEQIMSPHFRAMQGEDPLLPPSIGPELLETMVKKKTRPQIN